MKAFTTSPLRISLNTLLILFSFFVITSLEGQDYKDKSYDQTPQKLTDLFNIKPQESIYFPPPDATPEGARPVIVPATEGGCLTLYSSVGTLDERLCTHPELRRQIIWETATGAHLSYDYWPHEWKDRLNEFFQKMLNRDPNLGIHLPNPRNNMNQQTWAAGGLSFNPIMYLTEDEALDTYLAHCACVLWHEAMGHFSWSIFALPEDELAELLSSDRYHSRIVDAYRSSEGRSREDYYRLVGYPEHIRPHRDFQLSHRANNPFARGIGLLGDPRDGYNFITGRNSSLHVNLLGSTEEETLENLTLWFAQNVMHGSGFTLSPENTIEYYMTHNFLKDRLRQETRTFTARDGSTSISRGIFAPTGCPAVSNLFYDLCRSINIPVRNIFNFGAAGRLGNFAGHQGLIFRWIRPGTRMLDHSDIIYSIDGYYPFSPVDETGRRLSGEEAKRLFFRTHWMTPAELANYGYSASSDFSIRLREEFSANPFLIHWDTSEFGAYGGYWTDEAQGYELLYWEKQYLLCPYGMISCPLRTLISSRQSSGSTDYSIGIVAVESSISGQLSAFTPFWRTRARPVREYINRFLASISTYGEEDILRRYNEFLANCGQHQWAD